jgi:lysophospholipase L1-like esterase
MARLAAAAFIVLCVLALAAPASAQTDTFLVDALGDSVASGFGLHHNLTQNGICAAHLPTADCDSPGSAWPAKFADQLTGTDTGDLPVTFSNLAMGGAMTGDLIPGGLLADRVDKVIAADPDVILVTLGANDVVLKETLGYRHFNIGCLVRPGCAAKRMKAAHTEANLSTLFGELVADTGAEVIVTRYYHLDQDLTGVVGKINKVINAAAAPWLDEGVTVIDPPSFAGHGCVHHKHGKWMQHPLRDTCVHPNAKGAGKIAAAALDAYRALNE